MESNFDSKVLNSAWIDSISCSPSRASPMPNCSMQLSAWFSSRCYFGVMLSRFLVTISEWQVVRNFTMASVSVVFMSLENWSLPAKMARQEAYWEKSFSYCSCKVLTLLARPASSASAAGMEGCRFQQLMTCKGAEVKVAADPNHG